MQFSYLFLNSVAAKICCYYEWAHWEENSITCGKICRGQKGRLCQGAGCIIYSCHEKYTECKWYEKRELSCDVITCRELIFWMFQIHTNFQATLSQWETWSLCPVSCDNKAMQTRKRKCEFEGRNHTENADDTGCADGFQYGFYEEQKCNTQPCRMFE